ncbi:pyridoxamine 5'-phosphate oxidase family protein [uncultured Clostridium sp.]|uniref:pyridoxamine 5'-phosphate oxidase family protein n=1 Tax=uncultured Clostridium sp. TaxID=59620 RepID=UPI0028EC0BCC|nr:pyridoxamine 5'-phosphate oxidase family protein [uncultured Clostridium sp.]
MFREVRRKDRSLEEKDAIEVLKNGEYGVLSMVGENDYGYGVPLSYVYLGNAIYFHCAREGQKLDSIEKNNKVSFSVVGRTKLLPEKFSTEYESTIIFGKATEVNDEEKERALLAIIEKYSPEYIESGMEYIKRAADRTRVIKVSVENICGKTRK